MKKKIKQGLLLIQERFGVDMVYMARGSFWTTIGFIIPSLASLAVIWAFGNLISKETYGSYRYVLSLAGALGFLTFSGINTAITQAVARGSDSVLPYGVKVQVKWNQVYLLAAAILASYYWFQGNPTIATGLIIIGVLFPVTTAMNSYGSYLVGKKDFKTASLYGTYANLFFSLAMVATLLLTHSIVVLVAVYSVATFVPMLFFYLRTLSHVPKDKPTEDEKKELFDFGKHLSITHVFATISQYIDKIVIFHFLGPAPTAIYGLAMALPERIRGYTKNIGSLVLPRLSEKNMEEIIPSFYTRTFQCILLGIGVSALYIIAAPYVFKIFLPQYLDSVKYSQVISLSFIFNIPGTYMGSVFNSQKLIRTIYAGSLTGHISKIVSITMFGALWVIWGAIVALLISYAIGLHLGYYLWAQEVKRFKN